MVIFAWIGNKRLDKIRKNRRELFIQTDRSIVRLIMSKFEILQNSKITKELHMISEYFSNIIYWDKKESK
jgi:hypothetical protein